MNKYEVNPPYHGKNLGDAYAGVYRRNGTFMIHSDVLQRLEAADQFEARVALLESAMKADPLPAALRQIVEKEIASAFIKQALREGYLIVIDDGGDRPLLEPGCADHDTILAAMFSVDSEHLMLYKGKRYVGWVLFVYGNDGYDVISDYTTILDPLMTDAEVVSDKYQ